MLLLYEPGLNSLDHKQNFKPPFSKFPSQSSDWDHKQNHTKGGSLFYCRIRLCRPRPWAKCPKLCWHFHATELQNSHRRPWDLFLLPCFFPSLQTSQGVRSPRQLEPGLLGKELCNTRRGPTFWRALTHLPSADKICVNNTLRGHLVAGDMRRQHPKVSCPQGLCEELDYENAGWGNRTRTVFPSGASLCCDCQGWVVKWRAGTSLRSQLTASIRFRKS